VLAKADRKVLTLALKGTSEQLRNHILGCMSQRGADMLREGHGSHRAGQDQRGRSGAAEYHRAGAAAGERRRAEPEGSGREQYVV
jgi:hypothetical protein